MIIATAGHVDHGKTTLVKALTGKDTDTLDEEKRRGLTINLGFAYFDAELNAAESVRIGFIDVPGHHKFIHNMLSGVAGMRLGLALVAPGQRSRLQALRDASRLALPLVYGAGGMLVVAALIEAFWSPRPLPSELKYGVGGAMWALVALYLLFAGRSRAD